MEPQMERRHVLVLYSGGTVGLIWSDEQAEYQPLPLQALQSRIKTFPTLHDEDYHITDAANFDLIALPFVRDYKHRILYCMKGYQPLMDSANMNMADWAKLAKDIERYYDQFDGFVILHGTDTMCYTASALSFMLENLSKPVVLTGAQLPLSETRSDAHANILGALLIAGAGYTLIPEVCIYFNHQLFQGNRATKTSSTSFGAYSTPNVSPLVTLGMNVSIDARALRRKSPEAKLKVHPMMCPDVATLTIFPGMMPAQLEAFLQPPLKGAILQTYGAGHFPTHPPLLGKIREACDRGVVVVNCSQCSHGSTHTASQELCELGVVPGEDLTVEAALTKLSYLLGQPHLSVADIREAMQKDIRGEMSVSPDF